MRIKKDKNNPYINNKKSSLKEKNVKCYNSEED